MPSAKIRIRMNEQNFMSGRGELEFSDQPAASFSDMVLGFLEGGESPMSSSSEECHENEGFLVEDDDDNKENCGDAEENKSFWENQHQILQGTLCRTSSLESNIRSITKEAIQELQTEGTVCGCGRSIAAGGCRECLMTEVSGRLRNAGYNSAICKSKWRSSPDIPSGMHTFVDVVDNSNSKKGDVRVIIELNFRAEFEMAKASEEYNRLVRRLPEIYIGKIERLTAIIKILCLAAKKCMREKKMHMGPWRKHRYMQAKWLGTCERTTSVPPLPVGHHSSGGTSDRLPKPRASMLTVDLLEMLPHRRQTAVAVV